MTTNLASKEEIIYEGRRKMFNMEDRLISVRTDDFLREAEQRRLVNAAMAKQRRERRERLRRRLQSLVALIGLGHL